MKKVSEKEVISGVKTAFRDWFGFEEGKMSFQSQTENNESFDGTLKLNTTNRTFRIECSTALESARILSFVEKVYSNRDKHSELPILLAVPFMPGKAREMCQEYNLSWLDISGNAHIQETPLFIHVEGKENRFKQSGRPASVFAPKASMVSFIFLAHPNESFTVKDLVEKTEVSQGTVSRVTRRLESLGFIQQEQKKGRAKPYKLNNPFTMLDAWVEEYDFYKNEILKAAIPESGADGFYYQLREVLGSHYYEYSISGPRAANFYDVPAESSLAVAYVNYFPGEDALTSYGFHPGDRGANLWLTKPVSDVVYMGTEQKNDLPVVNPIQLYLDLTSIKAQRSEEVADQLYSNIRKEFEHAGF